jgi:hypothetical protein
LKVPNHVVVRFLEKDSLFLNLETRRHYGLDEIWTRMWQVVTAVPSIENAAELLNEFDIEAESELFVRLADTGLLLVHRADVETNLAV